MSVVGKTSDEERDRWIQVCLETLCSQYVRDHVVTLGVDTVEECGHLWCHGIVDVLRRAVGTTYYGHKR